MMVVCLHRGSSIEPRHQHDGVRNKPAAERIHRYYQHGSCLYFTAAKVIAYSLHINAGQITSFSYSGCKMRHSCTHLSDVEKVLLIGKCRTVAHNMLRHATPRQIHHLYHLASRSIRLPTVKENTLRQISYIFHKKYIRYLYTPASFYDCRATTA